MHWPARGSLARRRIAWAAVLAANLPAPILFAVMCTDVGGRVGMVLAVAFVGLLGHESCRRYPRVIRFAMPGGWVVAATQVWPVLHFLAGAIGLRIARFGMAAPVDDVPTAHGPLAGFTATLVTGAPPGRRHDPRARLPGRLLARGRPSLDGRAGMGGKPKVATDELA